MSIIEVKPEWTDVPQIEVGDRVRGGKDGPVNKQAQALANRIEKLKEDQQQDGAEVLDAEAQWSDVPKLKGEHANVQVQALMNRVEILRSGQVTEFKLNATSAATRLLMDKASDFVSLKDFGAIGDGVTDDTDAIEAAINLVKNSNQVLWVNDGDFLVTRKIFSDDGDRLTIRGCGGGTLYIQDGIQSVNLSAAAIVFKHFESVTVEGVRFITDSSNSCSILHTVGCKESHISNNWFKFNKLSVGSKCAIVQRSEDTTREIRAVNICDNIMYPGGAGALIIGDSSVHPYACHMDRNTLIYEHSVADAALKIDKYTKNFTMNGNIVYGNGKLTAGLAVEKQSRSGIISGNSIYGVTSRAINLNVDPGEGYIRFENLKVFGNLVDAAGFDCLYGVYLYSANTVSDRVEVSGNTIIGYSASIFEATGGQINNLIISSNNLIDCKGAGMQVKSNGAVVHKNVVTPYQGFSAYSLVPLETAIDIVIVGNIFKMYNTSTLAAIQSSVGGHGSGWVVRGNVGEKANTLTANHLKTSVPLGAEKVLLDPSFGAVYLTLDDGSSRGEGEVELAARASTNPCSVVVDKYNNGTAKTLTFTGTGSAVKLRWTGYSWIPLFIVGVTVS